MDDPTTAPLSLRRFAPADSEPCRALLAALSDWFSPGAVDAYVADLPRAPTWVATLGAGVAGLVTLARAQPRALEIHLLAVAPALQRHGVGRALLEHAERFARHAGARFLFARTLGPAAEDEFYARTREFYLRVGYEPLLESEQLWPDGQPALVLVKALG